MGKLENNKKEQIKQSFYITYAELLYALYNTDKLTSDNSWCSILSDFETRAV